MSPILSASAPTTLPPSGAAAGDLAGTYPNPALAAIGAAAGPVGNATTTPVVGIDAKGRVTSLAGATISGVVPGGTAGGALQGTYPNPTLVPLFDSTLGVDTASIDTGANGISTAFNTLEVWIYARTDEVAALSTLILTVNNDSSAIYDWIFVQVANTSASGGMTLANAGWQIQAAGASAAAGVYAAAALSFPSYAQTTGWKTGMILAEGAMDTTAANTRIRTRFLQYRATTAISRMALAPLTGGAKLKAGSRLLIFGR